MEVAPSLPKNHVAAPKSGFTPSSLRPAQDPERIRASEGATSHQSHSEVHHLVFIIRCWEGWDAINTDDPSITIPSSKTTQVS